MLASSSLYQRTLFAFVLLHLNTHLLRLLRMLRQLVSVDLRLLIVLCHPVLDVTKRLCRFFSCLRKFHFVTKMTLVQLSLFLQTKMISSIDLACVPHLKKWVSLASRFNLYVYLLMPSTQCVTSLVVLDLNNRWNRRMQSMCLAPFFAFTVTP